MTAMTAVATRALAPRSPVITAYTATASPGITAPGETLTITESFQPATTVAAKKPFALNGIVAMIPDQANRPHTIPHE